MLLAPSVPVTVHRVSIGDGLIGTRDTLRIMRALAREGSADPAVRDTAVSLIWAHAPKHELPEVSAIFEFVRDSIRYVRDPVQYEAVALPRKTLALRIGDCDDKCTLLAAMLESVGYPTRFVVAGYRSANPEHVYVQVLAHHQWIDADPTEPMPIGYAPPNPLFIDYERI